MRHRLVHVAGRGIIVRIRAIRVAKLTLWFLLLTSASVHAQAPQAAPERGSPLSEIAHDFTAWLSHVTGASAKQNRAALSPPLPRPRPSELAPAPVASNKDPAALASAPVASNKDPAALASAPIASNKDPAALAPAPVASKKDPSELAPVPVAPKKRTPAVLIND
jgi:hypothetical protein